MLSTHLTRPGPLHRISRRVLRAVIALGLTVLLMAAALPASAQTPPYAFTAPVTNAQLTPGQLVTITWTGGGPASVGRLLLIDVTAWTVSHTVALGIANSGSHAWTVPTSFPLGGPCGRPYQLYLESAGQTTWTYGPSFTICGTPASMIANLQTKLGGLGLPNGVFNPPNNSLNHALGHLPGNPNQACAKLNAFKTAVGNDVPTISAADAAAMQAEADAIKAAILALYPEPPPKPDCH